MTAPTDPLRLEPQRPWPGLRSFDESDSAYFFGRQREAATLRDMVERSPTVVLYGQSGLGKTSLLRAGLFPLLKASSLLPVWIRLDHSDGAPPLTRQLLETLHAACTAAGIEAPGPAADDSLWSYFHRADADFWGPKNRLYRPLLVLDQFEELYTLGRRDEAAARRSERFVQDLEALVEQRPPAEIRALVERQPERAADYVDSNRDNVRLLVSLREDFLPHLDAWSGRMPTLLAQRLRLEPMTREQALDVVLKGGASLVDEPVAREIVDFVSSSDGQRRVEPAILSVVCEELNTRRVDAGLAQITPKLLSGERGRIIADFYERSMAGVPEEVRDWVEDELLTASGHRDRAALEDARRAGLDPGQLELLVGRRVLHSDERNRVVWVEFTHDLLTAPAMASRTAREQRRAQAEAERREQQVAQQLRRTRRLAAVFGAMALCMAAITVWSFTLRREATLQRETAEAQTRAAEQQRSRALEQSARADEATQVALRREAEAERSAEAARVAADKADAEAARAGLAESQARRNLSQAEATAVQLAQQAQAALERQWLDPSADAARIVEVTLAGVEPLARQFPSVPALADARRRVHALAALVHAGREDEAQCSRLLREPSLDQRAAAAASATDRALVELARGQCLLLGGRIGEAEASFGRAVDATRSLHRPGALDFRLRLNALLGRASTAQARYAHDEHARHLEAARDSLQRASEDAAFSPDERVQWRLALLAAEARGVDSPVRALEIHVRLDREAAALTAARRESLGWRVQAAEYDVRRIWLLRGAQRLADAESQSLELIDALDRMAGIDPLNTRLQLLRNDAARLRSEILHGWRRQAHAAALIRDIESRVEVIVRRQPGHARARHQQGVLAWLLSQYSAAPDLVEREAKLESALQRFESLNRDLPDGLESIRSAAVASRDLGSLLRDRAAKASGAERVRLVEQAAARYAQAIGHLSRLRHAAQRRDIADLGGSIKLAHGDLELSRGRAPEALEHYREASKWQRAVMPDPADVADTTSNAVIVDMYIARALRVAGRQAEADAVDRATLAEIAQARRAAPDHFGLANQVSWVHRMAASDHLEQGRIEQALHSQLSAAEIMAEQLRRDPLSKGAEQALGQIHRYVKEVMSPKVEQTGRAEWKALLAELDKRSSPTEAVPLGEDRPTARLPRLPGDWEHLETGSLAQYGAALQTHLAELKARGWSTVAARRLALPFYERASMLEIDVRQGAAQTGIASYLVDTRGTVVPLRGKSPPVHDYNAKHELSLRTEAQARQYLRFFTGVLDSDSGAFRLVGDPNELMWSPQTPLSVITPVLGQLEPLRLASTRDGTWTAQGTMQWGAELFLVKLTLGRDGSVAMDRDNGRRLKLPLETTRYSRDGVRIRDATPALDLAAETAIRDGKIAEAAAAMRAGIEARRSWMTDAEQKSDLPGRYVDLSWQHLVARDPSAALEATRSGLVLTPDNLPLQTNRAHALLLLGREGEAMAVYRQYVGQRVGGPSSRLWEDEILNDLDQLEKRGLKDPRFAGVRSLLQGARR